MAARGSDPPWLSPDRITAGCARKIDARRSAAGYALASARDVVSVLDGDGSHVFALTKGKFSMIDVVRACLEMSGPAEVSLWTWCVADYELLTLSEIARDCRITSARLVVDRAGALRQRHFLAWWLRRFGEDSLRITKTHAKIAMIRGKREFVARGSLNLNENPRLENLDVSGCGEVVALIEDAMADLWRLIPAPLETQLNFGQCSEAFEMAFGCG